MSMEELRRLPELIPALRDCAFYVSGFGPVVDDVVMPLADAALKLAPDVLGRPYARLLTWALRRSSRPPYRMVLAGSSTQGGAAGADEERGRAGLRLLHEDGYRPDRRDRGGLPAAVPGRLAADCWVSTCRPWRSNQRDCWAILQRMGGRLFESFGVDVGRVIGSTGGQGAITGPWREAFPVDPLPRLLESGEPAARWVTPIEPA